tara:strand:+ start:1625 stop:1852 length:228 start_codon:yes stop_codon:yes gene_type:complete
MQPADLKIEFEKQLKDADSKIAAAENTLKGLQEYKMKLQGGLETLELLNPSEPKPAAEIVAPPTPPAAPINPPTE